jgi:hypothetical protein
LYKLLLKKIYAAESQRRNSCFPIFYSARDSSTLAPIHRALNVYRNQSNSKRQNYGSINIFDELLAKKTNDEPNVRLYHGTDIEAVKAICGYGINLNLYNSHRLGTDFGAGFYITEIRI